MQLDKIVDRIERAFGEAAPFSGRPLAGSDIEILQRIFGDEAYQDYVQDQVDRQIIRDYLANAVMLGVISEGDLSAFDGQLASQEGRAAMALHMLMSSVEDASHLLPLVSGGIEVLEPLKPGPDSRPHMKLVPS